MKVRVDVSADLLHWAVDRAGWDPETTARRAPYFNEWKAGTKQPTLKQLQDFASATHAPFGMLFLTEPPIEEVPIPDMRTIGNKAVPRPSADLLDTIYLCQARQDWYREYTAENRIPPPELVSSASTRTPPKDVAGRLRDELGFNLSERSSSSNWETAFRQLIDRIEELGVLVMINGVVGANNFRTLNPEEFRGFALTDTRAPLIFINGADTKAAQIFTIIHELAHVCLGMSALSDATMAGQVGNDHERWCNEVAAEVLLPLESLRKDFKGAITISELERLAKLYRVSTLVVTKRIFDAGFLAWDEYQETYRAEHARVIGLLAAGRARTSGGNFYYTQPIRLSHTFAKSVVASTLEGSTTYREAYRLLGIKKHSTFENLAEELEVA
ncbi:ImmA/IrrE family metallo-endopeptidase [Changpingibacter yushuensis]|uniref:ImmA/IrrE family metallo-endopeptidase n=1 Tax=Changpingibacter yushuensis TaxID=2758440 RepID=UPI0015F462CA|nr:ImmA/IrrE family metallo-endopeptidase [Changpingibacter yushuensis]